MVLRDKKRRKGQSTVVPCDPLSANAREARCKAAKTAVIAPPPRGILEKNGCVRKHPRACPARFIRLVPSMLFSCGFMYHILYHIFPLHARGRIQKSFSADITPGCRRCYGRSGSYLNNASSVTSDWTSFE